MGFKPIRYGYTVFHPDHKEGQFPPLGCNPKSFKTMKKAMGKAESWGTGAIIWRNVYRMARGRKWPRWIGLHTDKVWVYRS